VTVYDRGMLNAPILIDADGVLCNFIDPFLQMANTVTGLDKTVHDLTTWDMLPMYPKEKHTEILNELVKPGWCLGLAPYKGARDAVDELRKIAKVYCVTAPWTSTTWCYERTQWLMEHMGFDRHEVMHVHDKWLVHGLTLIDDKAETLVRWQDATGKRGILVSQPYNRSFNEQEHGIWRAESLAEAAKLVAALV